MRKAWIRSKTFWGATLIALSGVLSSMGHYLLGTLTFASALASAVTSVGIFFSLIGLRDAMA